MKAIAIPLLQVTNHIRLLVGVSFDTFMYDDE